MTTSHQPDQRQSVFRTDFINATRGFGDFEAEALKAWFRGLIVLPEGEFNALRPVLAYVTNKASSLRSHRHNRNGPYQQRLGFNIRELIRPELCRIIRLLPFLVRHRPHLSSNSL